MRQWAVVLVFALMLMGCTPAAQSDAIASTSTIVPEAKSMDSLSADAQQAFLDKVSAEQNIPVDQLQILTTKEADWPDACLGLASPDELCAQMILPGWAITVSDSSQVWSYRTDLEMELVKLEPQS